MRKVSKKQQERNKVKAKETKKMRELFLQIWDEREDPEGFCYCYETGKRMDPRIYRGNSSCYDHVLEKGVNSYPEYKLVKRNIIIILPEVHIQKGNDIDKCPRIKAYREYLLSLHSQDELKD